MNKDVFRTAEFPDHTNIVLAFEEIITTLQDQQVCGSRQFLAPVVRVLMRIHGIGNGRLPGQNRKRMDVPRTDRERTLAGDGNRPGFSGYQAEPVIT